MSQFINFVVELYDELLNETKHDYSEDIIKGFRMTHSEVEAVAEFYRNAARKENSKKAKEKSLSWYEKIGLGCDEEENCKIRISRMADALYRMYLSEPCLFTTIDNSKFHKVIMELEKEIWFFMGNKNDKVELAIFLDDNTVINANRLSSILEMNKEEAEVVAKYYKNKKEKERAIAWKKAECKHDNDFQNLNYWHRVLVRVYNENPTAYNLETILRRGFSNMPTSEWDIIYRYLCKLDDKKYNRILEIIWYEYL